MTARWPRGLAPPAARPLLTHPGSCRPRLLFLEEICTLLPFRRVSPCTLRALRGERRRRESSNTHYIYQRMYGQRTLHVPTCTRCSPGATATHTQPHAWEPVSDRKACLSAEPFLLVCRAPGALHSRGYLLVNFHPGGDFSVKRVRASAVISACFSIAFPCLSMASIIPLNFRSTFFSNLCTDLSW